MGDMVLLGDGCILLMRCTLRFLTEVVLVPSSPPPLQLRIGALIRKDGQEGHPFIKGGTAYPASLIGKEAAAIVVGSQRGEIVRVRSEDLAAKV